MCISLFLILLNNHNKNAINKFFRILFCKKVNINIIKDAFIGKYSLSYFNSFIL